MLRARMVCRFAGPACKLCQLSLGSKNRGSICAEFNPACAIVRITIKEIYGKGKERVRCARKNADVEL